MTSPADAEPRPPPLLPALVAAAGIAVIVGCIVMAVWFDSGDPPAPLDWTVEVTIRSPEGDPLPYADLIASVPALRGLTVGCDVDEEGRSQAEPAMWARPEDVREVTFTAMLGGPSKRSARIATKTVYYPATHVTLVLDPEPSLTLEIAGWPADAAEVDCQLVAGPVRPGKTPGPGVVMSGVSSEAIKPSGRVRFPALSDALSYYLWAHVPAHDAYVLESGLEAGKAQRHRVSLRKGHTLEGSILGLKPGQDVDVTAFRSTDDRSLSAYASWDGKSSFVFRGLPAGEWRIDVRARAPENGKGPQPGYFGRRKVTLPAGPIKIRVKPF